MDVTVLARRSRARRWCRLLGVAFTRGRTAPAGKNRVAFPHYRRHRIAPLPPPRLRALGGPHDGSRVGPSPGPLSLPAADRCVGLRYCRRNLAHIPTTAGVAVDG